MTDKLSNNLYGYDCLQVTKAMELIMHQNTFTKIIEKSFKVENII